MRQILRFLSEDPEKFRKSTFVQLRLQYDYFDFMTSKQYFSTALQLLFNWTVEKEESFQSGGFGLISAIIGISGPYITPT